MLVTQCFLIEGLASLQRLLFSFKSSWQIMSNDIKYGTQDFTGRGFYCTFLLIKTHHKDKKIKDEFFGEKRNNKKKDTLKILRDKKMAIEKLQRLAIKALGHMHLMKLFDTAFNN